MRETAKAGDLDTHKNGKCKHVKDTEALNQRQKTTTMRGARPLTGSPARLCTSKGSEKNRKHLINLAQYQRLMLKSTHYFYRNDTILT